MGISCTLCGNVLSTQSAYNRHLKGIHGQIPRPKIISYDFAAYNPKCLECRCSFLNLTFLRQHLLQEHSIDPEENVYNFDSYEDFQLWFNQLCSEDKVNFCKEKGNYKSSLRTVTYYNCHRSRTSTAQIPANDERRKRMKKSQGSCKMDYFCTSQIKLTQVNGRYEVIYFKKHYGHEKDVKHLRISKELRLEVANKLALGESTSKIFDDVMDNSTTDESKYLLKRSDINNIRMSYGIPKISEEKPDNSTEIINMQDWIQEEINKKHNSSVLFYKPKGITGKQFAKDDFILIVMNESQQIMLKRFGENIICISATHDLDKYDYETTIVLVVDEYCEIFPVACMFSSRKDNAVLKFFFECIKEKIGRVLKTKTVVTAMTNIYINAWMAVMDSPEHFFYCKWHVYREWQRKLKEIVNLKKRDNLYKSLKSLQSEVNVETFRTNLYKFITLTCEDPELLEFGEYFKQTYGSNYRHWALCFREQCKIKSDINITLMNKVIKNIDLNGKVGSCKLDEELYAILKYIKGKIIDRIQKNKKGMTTKKICYNRNRHRMSLTANYSVEFDLENGVYTVIDNDNNLKQYHVKKLLDEMCCKVSCTFCQICIHCFNCTCMDYLNKKIICKHIHFAVINMPSRGTDNNINSDHTDAHMKSENDSEPETAPYHLLKNTIRNQITEILGKVETTTNENVLCKVSECLKDADLFLDIEINKRDIKETNHLPNKKRIRNLEDEELLFNKESIDHDHIYSEMFMSSES